MTELGRLLRELRGKESLRDVGRRSGVSHNYLSLVEKGIDPRSGTPINPSPETLKRLSEAYKYPYVDLLVKAGYLEEAHAEVSKRDHIEASKNKVIEEFEKLPDHHKELIENMIKTLLESQQQN